MNKEYIYKDLGTPELIFKRAYNITKEPLDLCYKKKLISNNQHIAGIIYKLLFTKIYGLPYTRAYDFSRIKGIDLQAIIITEEQVNIENFYNDVSKLLTKKGYKKIISDICIFGIYPEFLNLHRSKYFMCSELIKFKEGMKFLETLIYKHQ